MRELLRKLEMSREQVLHLEAAISLLRRENELLLVSLQEQQAKATALETECAEWKERYEAKQGASGPFSEEEKAELQAKIELYLKEIDSCLNFFGD